jgi:hypothetical protein
MIFTRSREVAKRRSLLAQRRDDATISLRRAGGPSIRIAEAVNAAHAALSHAASATLVASSRRRANQFFAVSRLRANLLQATR